MDNYEVAISGTNLAAQILGIEAPEVQFFYNQNYSKRGINSIFLKEKYIITSAFIPLFIYTLNNFKKAKQLVVKPRMRPRRHHF